MTWSGVTHSLLLLPLALAVAVEPPDGKQRKIIAAGPTWIASPLRRVSELPMRLPRVRSGKKQTSRKPTPSCAGSSCAWSMPRSGK